MTGQHLRHGLFGIGLGFALSRIGFTDFGEVHRMFLFADLRLFLTFVCAVVVAGAGFTIVRRRHDLGRSLLHRGVLPGSIAFGLGWALTGACPGVAFAQLGEGKLLAIATVAGIFVGNCAYGRVHRRFFRWDNRSCGS